MSSGKSLQDRINSQSPKEKIQQMEACEVCHRNRNKQNIKLVDISSVTGSIFHLIYIYFFSQSGPSLFSIYLIILRLQHTFIIQLHQAGREERLKSLPSSCFKSKFTDDGLDSFACLSLLPLCRKLTWASL